MTTRAEHLAWCKQRALAELDAGNMQAAVMSMVSDLTKIEPPLYDQETFTTITAEGMFLCKTPEQVRHWIEGFG